MKTRLLIASILMSLISLGKVMADDSSLSSGQDNSQAIAPSASVNDLSASQMIADALKRHQELFTDHSSQPDSSTSSASADTNSSSSTPSTSSDTSSSSTPSSTPSSSTDTSTTPSPTPAPASPDSSSVTPSTTPPVTTPDPSLPSH